MAIFSVFQILSVLAVALYLIGILNNLFSDRENACEMTYMYEYPQYVVRKSKSLLFIKFDEHLKIFFKTFSEN